MKWPKAPDDAILSMSFGDSIVGNLAPSIRHILWWGLSLGLLAVSYFDKTAIEAVDEVEWQGIVLAGMGATSLGFLAVEIVRGIQLVPVWQSLSRVTVSTTFLVGLLTLLLGGLRVEAFPCNDGVCPRPAAQAHAANDEPTSDDPALEFASPRNLVELLFWHTVDVVPAIDLTDAIEWQRPATSSDLFVRGAAFALRVFVIVIVIGALSELWKTATKPWNRPTTFGELRAYKDQTSNPDYS